MRNEKIRRILLRIGAVLSLLLMIVAVRVTALALSRPKDYYDSISWTYDYSGPSTSSYNCLGYATGSMTWEWPWKNEYVGISQVKRYLDGKGYTQSDKYPVIIVYGKSKSDIKHFSKVTDKDWCRAKWGALERFNHHSYDPYYSNSIYGKKIAVFSRKYY